LNENEQVGVAGPCPSDSCPAHVKTNVYDMLQKGSPRLAYALACGVPLGPWKTTISAIFDTTTTATVPEVGNNIKIVQDTIIDRISCQVQNNNTPSSDFSSLADYFFSLQSGILAKLKVVGAPRYSVVDQFTPISEIVGPTDGWILGLTNGLIMDFSSTITLPAAPLTVNFVFHGRTSYWAKLIKLDDATCVRQLEAKGYDVSMYSPLYC
jgi:hypothetical protein